MTINLKNHESYLLDYLEGNLSKELLVEMEVFLSNHPEIANQLTDEPLPRLNSDEVTIPSFSGLKQPLVWNEKEVEGLLLNSLENQLESNDLNRLSQFKTAFPAEYSRLEKLLGLTQLPKLEMALGSDFKEKLTQLDLSSNSAQLIAFTEGDLNSAQKLKLESKLKEDSGLTNELKIISALKLTPDTNVSLSNEFKNSLKQEKKGIIIPIWFRRTAVAAVVLFGLFLLPLSGEEEIAYQPRIEESSVAEFEYENSQKVGDEETIATHTETIEDDPIQESETPIYKASFNPNQLAETSAQERVKPEPLEIMTSKSYQLASLIEVAPASLISDYIMVDLDFSEWPESDLATENEVASDALSIVELAEVKTKETLGEEDEDNLALAFVNSGAKKLLNTDEDVLAYEKEERGGFKFSLGKLSVERIK